MNSTTNPASAPTEPPPSLGLAIASLVLGILAVCLGLWLVGGLLGIIGAILGFVHLRRPGVPKAMAWWGVSLSLVGLLLSLLAIVAQAHLSSQIDKQFRKMEQEKMQK